MDQCKEGFDLAEAKASGICVDCDRRWCDHHPEYKSWRKERGLERQRAFEEANEANAANAAKV